MTGFALGTVCWSSGATRPSPVRPLRRRWRRCGGPGTAGAEVVVVSPRPSAAPFVVPLAGPALGRELAKLRLAHACNEVVLCLEPGWPFAGQRSSRAQGAARTARALAQALSGFERAELVVTGELGVAPEVLALLWPLVGARHCQLRRDGFGSCAPPACLWCALSTPSPARACVPSATMPATLRPWGLSSQRSSW